MAAKALWIQLTLELGEHIRYGTPAITRTAQGDLEVNGEPVLERAIFNCGLVALATASGLVVVRREALNHWPDLFTQALARDLQA